MAFKDFRYDTGLWNSPFVGLKYINQFINSYDFWMLIKNTLTISMLRLIFGFPAPIILALMLNSVVNYSFKRVIQTVSYLPYFVSWVVVITLFNKFLSPNAGPVNELLSALFNIEAIYFMGNKNTFYPLVIIIDIWKNVGWSSIVYLAALSGISPELYEASAIDGAGKFKSLLHITLPCLLPTVGILFILSFGNILKAGFEQIFLMQTPPVQDISEILDTYVLKVGISRGQFSLASAVGLFQSVISLILIIVVNKLVKKFTEISLW